MIRGGGRLERVALRRCLEIFDFAPLTSHQLDRAALGNLILAQCIRARGEEEHEEEHKCSVRLSRQAAAEAKKRSMKMPGRIKTLQLETVPIN